MVKKLLLASFCFLFTYAFSENEPYQFVGSHFLASYYDCDFSILDNPDALKEAMAKAIEHSGATLLKMADYQFAPHGVTLVALLSESHASIHTYPEFGACFVDFFTCGTKCNYKEFDRVFKEALGSKKASMQFIERK